MRIRYKQQPFQWEAVRSVVDVFRGQTPAGPGRAGAFAEPGWALGTGNVSNRPVEVPEADLLRQLQEVQQRGGLPRSERLEGHYNLTVEMETGTGKTYTYIRTMFELYREYGWGQYIIVVPSIAIREGVLKTFEMTEDHFMEQYGMKARCFVYSSRQPHQIARFAADGGIQVMIINSQAFAARGQDARRIYMELDDFQSRRPIDVLADTRPILIIDEPQSVEGAKTKEALKDFRPLFTLRYSATHRAGETYNKVYRLDALDAYNMKLVKKISVVGITTRQTAAGEGYLYLEGVDLSRRSEPAARIEFEHRTAGGIRRTVRKLREGDSLYRMSALECYRDHTVAEIDGRSNTVRFTNGVSLRAGDALGAPDEAHLRRLQIRETIREHLIKERRLYPMGIKVLSLFFIDEVAKYRRYGDQGQELPGEYARIFEEEYAALAEEAASETELVADGGDGYSRYLREIAAASTHKGYFSIDRRSSRLTDPKVGAKETDSEDADAYDLIMRDKERLLWLEEPTRFLFSHSALKEGWDNPNVFQICTLKSSGSSIQKRQEVGRGLRLCVNQDGERMDADIPGLDVHGINRLTVVASESYEQFAKELQSQIAETLSDRPRRADAGFFTGKVLSDGRGGTLRLDEVLAVKLHRLFIRQGYVDDADGLTGTYYEAVEGGALVLPEELEPYREALAALIRSVYTEGRTEWVDDGRGRNLLNLTPNDQFYKREFQELWSRINRKSVYTVRFDSDELVAGCIRALDEKLTVPQARYWIRQGEMERIESKAQLQAGTAFRTRESRVEYGGARPLPQGEEGSGSEESGRSETAVRAPRFDLLGKLAAETLLTRRTVAAILSGIRPDTFRLFARNPEEFLLRAAKLIREEKASAVIASITYDVTHDTFDSGIFTRNSLQGQLGRNAYPTEKHVFDYVVTDSKVEQEFARNLDAGQEVLVYAKLPRGFYIPTPVGEYHPDWAIALKEESRSFVYFIAETKGTLDTLELREVERVKIECARRHFAKLNDGRVAYGVVDSYEKLLEIVRG
ncbi:type III restriction-modification system endonuclease [Gorillibacterium sp. sgz5001074]|uniref:type III restriction-modification system endonuclease n=1 Tax=Gorillibacterium sp. sgz5001074 TaxID=3446695 RepID=UPI003F680B51